MITKLKDGQEMSELLMDLVDKQAGHFKEPNHQWIFKLTLVSKILNSISGPSDLRLAVDKERTAIEDICGLSWENE